MFIWIFFFKLFLCYKLTDSFKSYNKIVFLSYNICNNIHIIKIIYNDGHKSTFNV